MDVFVGNLPNGLGAGEIESLFRPYGRQVHFRIVRTVGDDGVAHRFAHGVIYPERRARRALARVNGKRLLGKTLVVRPYVHRAYGNERRALDWRQRPWPWAERRQAERRQHHETRAPDAMATPPIDSPWYGRWFDMELEELDHVHVEGYRNFAVKHAL